MTEAANKPGLTGHLNIDLERQVIVLDERVTTVEQSPPAPPVVKKFSLALTAADLTPHAGQSRSFPFPGSPTLPAGAGVISARVLINTPLAAVGLGQAIGSIGVLSNADVFWDQAVNAAAGDYIGLPPELTFPNPARDLAGETLAVRIFVTNVNLADITAFDALFEIVYVDFLTAPIGP